MSLNNKFFFLAPLEVVKVTTENLQETAEWCGGTIHETESRRVKGRMDSYVLVPTPKGNSTSWAFPGMYITRRLVVTEKDQLKSTFSVFRRDYFEKNCFDTIQLAVDATWERDDRERVEARQNKTAVESAMADALEKKPAVSIVEQRETQREREVEAETLVPGVPTNEQIVTDDAALTSKTIKKITSTTKAV